MCRHTFLFAALVPVDTSEELVAPAIAGRHTLGSTQLKLEQISKGKLLTQKGNEQGSCCSPVGCLSVLRLHNVFVASSNVLGSCILQA